MATILLFVAATALGGPRLFPSLFECLVAPFTAMVALVSHVIEPGNTIGFLFLVTLFATLWRFARVFPHMVAFLAFNPRFQVDTMKLTI